MERSRQPDAWPADAGAVAYLHALPWSFSRILASVAGLVGVGTLAGLTRGVSALAGVRSEWEPIKLNGVIGILLATAALLLVERPGRPPHRTLQVIRVIRASLATAVLVFGVATLAEYVLSIDLGLDDLVFRLPASTHASPRMSPAGSFSLSALATALLLLDTRSPSLRALVHGCAQAAAAVPLVALLGYAYGARELYQIAHYAPFALPSAFALFLLGLALLCVRPDHGLLALMIEGTSGGKLVRRTMPVMLTSPLVLGWLALRGELSGLYGPSAGTALFALASMTTFGACIRRHAAALSRSERAFCEGEARRRAIVETAMDGIITVDEGGIVDSYNPAAERIFGYRPAEVVGRGVSALVPEPFWPAHDGPLARDDDGAAEPAIVTFGREVLGRRKDGSIVPLDLSVGEALLGDRRLYTGIVRDVTERNRAHAEREVLLESERAARCTAERATRTKDDFVATVSHELRTPLNAILGWAVMLRQGRLDEGAKARALEVIERNVRTQSRMIEDLLDMSRIVSGKQWLDVQRVELGETVSSVLVAAQPAARAKGVQLESAVETEGNAVRGDPTRLVQAVGNLLSNAVKFTPPGGSVQVSLRREASSVVVVVADTGIGICPEFLGHVFDRFRQADASITRRHGGLGLGLALVKHIVELHGGVVSAESDGEGHGATFTMSLPAAEAGEHRNAEPAAAVPQRAPSIEGLGVLVVDDEPDVRDLVARILTAGKAIVRDVGSASEALDEIARLRPDVLLSDIGMPERDGYQLIEAVRALGPDRGGRTPAAALTAFARPEDRARALGAGFQAHVTKPIDPGELVQVVASLGGRAA